MDFFAKFFAAEPAVAVGAVTAIVNAGIYLALSFGANITPTQNLAIGGMLAALLGLVTLLASFVTRSQVTPVNPPQA